MSAQAQMRAMLDQLMGTARDGDSMRQRIKFTDDRVCKSHLLDCCPHDILSGTRMDLGECVKVHDLALRADYEIASKNQEFFFELDVSLRAPCLLHLTVTLLCVVSLCGVCTLPVSPCVGRVHELNEEIGKLLARAEQLGGEGNVEEAQQVLEKVEKTRELKREAEDVYRNSMPASSFQQQKLRVCEVCSAYLGLHDNDRRLADHFGGKLHLGFIEIREKLEKMKVIERQRKGSGERERCPRPGDGERHRERDKSGSPERDGERQGPCGRACSPSLERERGSSSDERESVCEDIGRDRRSVRRAQPHSQPRKASRRRN
uniref:Zgc:158803 n=1 Tax=Lepisosteus oculatus TaxID=7918 RepID=W5N231_LEPOC